MQNIVWKRPDGGVSVTIFTPEALEQQAWAAANMSLLEQKIELVAERAALVVAIEAGADQLARIAAQRSAAEEAGLDDALADADKLLEDLGAAQKKNKADLAAIAEQLAIVARLEEIRDSMGFDAHGHEMLLLKRGDIPADHVCVGHGLELPADRTFRGAWVFDAAAGAVAHDLAKCVEIRKDQMRAARQPLMAALDCQWMRATGQGDTAAAAAVEAERQVLRDVTKDPDLAVAKTPEALAAVWPDCLT